MGKNKKWNFLRVFVFAHYGKLIFGTFCQNNFNTQGKAQ
jgi:hypothetical protein